MWLVMKPRFRRDVRQGEGSGFHETNRPLNTEPQHELVRRDPDGSAEEAGQKGRGPKGLPRGGQTNKNPPLAFGQKNKNLGGVGNLEPNARGGWPLVSP